MQRDDNKTIHLGWIALRVVADADGNAISAHVVLHAEKDLSPLGALTLAQVAEVAEADLLDRVLAPASGAQATATGAAPRDGHAAICAMDGEASACPCQRAISGSSSSGSEHGGH
ncbi:hypothetical protein [Stenotrophomonas maltophilia]|uniref:hypothetical protein n=1 Tax=Stenotrophomonas maltophilia TaxID=40324 RepID=UPI001660F10C|nr:hypothetical protein [Stenotrophomonas maltophilia]